MDVDEVKGLYYKEHLSAKEVGERLNKTVWQVMRFMKTHNLSRRKCNESLNYVISRKPLSFNKKKDLSVDEQRLYIAGLMLYWAEGVKTGGVTVDFTNSDPIMVKIFLSMLRKIYRVDESRLRALIYCYANQDLDELKRFWINTLRIKSKQFIKPYVRKDFKLEKIEKMRYGLVHVRYNDKKLFSQIHEDIGIIARSLIND